MPEQASSSKENPKSHNEPQVATEPGYIGKLKEAGYKVAGVGSIALVPGLAITEDANIEAILVAAAEQSYENSEPAWARTFSSRAKHTLEVYREVISQYGANRVIVTVRLGEANVWQHLGFHVKPLKGERIDFADTIERVRDKNSRRHARGSSDEISTADQAHQPPTVQEGRDLNLGDHETREAA